VHTLGLLPVAVARSYADPFRLAIVGYAKIEERLDEALREAFGETCRGSFGAPSSKLASPLAVALNLIPDVLRGPLGKIAEVRHKFAHTEIQELTASDARDLYSACRQLAPDIESEVDSHRAKHAPSRTWMYSTDCVQQRTRARCPGPVFRELPVNLTNLGRREAGPDA
jgi:hypothetical protein